MGDGDEAHFHSMTNIYSYRRLMKELTFPEYESSDGEDEGREYDYMSDSGSDSE